MPSRIQQLLEGRDTRIDYDKLIKNYPWIVQKNVNCILSPDSDGFLCGLLMSHYLNWKIVGFYDGKVMALKKGIKSKNCVFLDIEIFRKNVSSIGHHMLLFNKNQKTQNWVGWKKCISPNNMREYDAQHDFRLKYPLATIHLLIGILGHSLKIKVPESAISALFFTDGTFNVLFGYPENVLNWLKYLRAHEDESPLKNIFENTKYSVYTLMLEMDVFFRKRDEISVPNERGDRLRISLPNGKPFNFIKQKKGHKLKDDAINRIKKFIKILSELTMWEFKENNWLWDNFNLYKFTKDDFEGNKRRLNNQTFNAFIQKNPLSWAVTSRQNIEYTLEKPNKLL